MLRDELQCKRRRSYRLKLILSDLRENGILLEKKTLFPTANIEQLTVHNPSQCRFLKKKKPALMCDSTQNLPIKLKLRTNEKLKLCLCIDLTGTEICIGFP